MFWRKKKFTAKDYMDAEIRRIENRFDERLQSIQCDMQLVTFQAIQDHERAMQFMCKAQQELGGEIEFYHSYTSDGCGLSYDHCIKYELIIDGHRLDKHTLEKMLPLYES